MKKTNAIVPSFLLAASALTAPLSSQAGVALIPPVSDRANGMGFAVDGNKSDHHIWIINGKNTADGRVVPDIITDVAQASNGSYTVAITTKFKVGDDAQVTLLKGPSYNVNGVDVDPAKPPPSLAKDREGATKDTQRIAQNTNMVIKIIQAQTDKGVDSKAGACLDENDAVAGVALPNNTRVILRASRGKDGVTYTGGSNGPPASDFTSFNHLPQLPGPLKGAYEQALDLINKCSKFTPN